MSADSDSRLRRHGFEVHSRPKGREPVWRRKVFDKDGVRQPDALYCESTALAICDEKEGIRLRIVD